MKKPLTILVRAAAGALLAFLAQNAQSNVLYNDIINTQNGNFNNGNATEGNEVTLAGAATGDLITSFAFQADYIGSLLTPAATFSLSFYKNNGPLFSGYASPGTLIWTSGPFSFGGYTPATGSSISFAQADLGGGVLVPQDFTWVVTFAGLQGGENAGLSLYSPATVGENYNDAWVNNGSGWVLDVATVGNPPLDFGAEIGGTPVPDSSCLSISVMAVLAGFGWMKRLQRRA
jgi:hypothetical protein